MVDPLWGREYRPQSTHTSGQESGPVRISGDRYPCSESFSSLRHSCLGVILVRFTRSSTYPFHLFFRTTPNKEDGRNKEYSKTMSTRIPSAKEIQRKWFVLDASGKTLGRLATQAANVLSSKLNPLYTPYIDTGDHRRDHQRREDRPHGPQG